jgi:ribonuclease-3
LTQLAEEIHNAACHWHLFDYKTRFQEEMQKQGKRPVYEVTSMEGPDHCKVFTVMVHADGKSFGQGRGRSKKEAEQMAAMQALESPFVNTGGQN